MDGNPVNDEGEMAANENSDPGQAEGLAEDNLTALLDRMKMVMAQAAFESDSQQLAKEELKMEIAGLEEEKRQLIEAAKARRIQMDKDEAELAELEKSTAAEEQTVGVLRDAIASEERQIRTYQEQNERTIALHNQYNEMVGGAAAELQEKIVARKMYLSEQPGFQEYEEKMKTLAELEETETKNDAIIETLRAELAEQERLATSGVSRNDMIVHMAGLALEQRNLDREVNKLKIIKKMREMRLARSKGRGVEEEMREIRAGSSRQPSASGTSMPSKNTPKDKSFAAPATLSLRQIATGPVRGAERRPAVQQQQPMPLAQKPMAPPARTPVKTPQKTPNDGRQEEESPVKKMRSAAEPPVLESRPQVPKLTMPMKAIQQQQPIRAGTNGPGAAMELRRNQHSATPLVPSRPLMAAGPSRQQLPTPIVPHRRSSAVPPTPGASRQSLATPVTSGSQAKFAAKSLASATGSKFTPKAWDAMQVNPDTFASQPNSMVGDKSPMQSQDSSGSVFLQAEMKNFFNEGAESGEGGNSGSFQFNIMGENSGSQSQSNADFWATYGGNSSSQVDFNADDGGFADDGFDFDQETTDDQFQDGFAGVFGGPE